MCSSRQSVAGLCNCNCGWLFLGAGPGGDHRGWVWEGICDADIACFATALLLPTFLQSKSTIASNPLRGELYTNSKWGSHCNDRNQRVPA